MEKMRETKQSRKVIGILGGLGSESTITYYSYITRTYYELYKDYAYPEIIIYSVNFQEFIDAGYELQAKVKSVIESLAKAGADFVVASCNSIHIVYDKIAKDLPIPWLSIMDVTAEQIKKANIKKVGLLGTTFTMTKGFYVDAFTRHGIETLLPNKDDQKTVNDIIYHQLVRAITKDLSRQTVLKIIDRLHHAGAQAVVLGCTELPFLITAKDTNVPIFDTTTIHAQKALDIALKNNGY